jgi:uncharacterized protein DUF6677
LRKSIKAALFSAFIFPGSGHLLLKKYVQGVLLVSISTVCLYFLISNTVEIAQEISDKILSSEIPIDVDSIRKAISMQLESRDTQLINISTYLFFICWLISIIDSYRLGYLVGKDVKKVNK